MAVRKYKKRDFDVGKSLPLPDTAGGGEPSLEETKRPAGWKKFLATTTLLILAFLVLIAAWDAINVSRAAKKVFGSGNLIELIGSSPLKLDGKGRANALIVGYSADDPGHPGATLTDSIMLLSMVPGSRTGYMLSVPRDLYVRYPDGHYAKVNEAYQDGGWPLLDKLIMDKLGVDVAYHFLVNYTAVRDTVDALGGITVNITSPDPRGLYDPNISPADGGPLKLSNGWQQLNGQTALNLTRARGAKGGWGFPLSDFNRTQNQKIVFLAIKQKAGSMKLILNPSQNGRIFDAIGGNVKSNLELSEVLPFYRLFTGIPDSSMKSIGLNNINGKNLLSSYGNGLAPAAGLNDYSVIRSALVQLP